MCIKTYHDEKNKVDPVPEGVRVLDVVHNGDPALQTDDLKDGDPGEADVIERDGAFERVLVAGSALGVVRVPVHAHRLVQVVVGGAEQFDGAVADARVVYVGRYLGARGHAVAGRLGAYEAVCVVGLVVGSTAAHPQFRK